jgi:hypothetical protein
MMGLAVFAGGFAVTFVVLALAVRLYCRMARKQHAAN